MPGDESASQDARLSRIETLWSVVRRAHDSEGDSAAEAQSLLLRRYDGAIRRYLLGAVRNPDLADELFQDFALKFMRGDFRNADPSRGKFRAFVKTILFRMVASHYRTQGRRKEVQPGERPLEEVAGQRELQPDEPMDELFLVSWRDEILAQTWQRLLDYEQQGGGPYHTVLNLRVTNPALNSDELAAAVSQALDKPVKSGAARVLVHRSRDKFSQLLIDQVADSLNHAGLDAIEEELIDLRLIDYCRQTLDERRQQESSGEAEDAGSD